MGSISETNYTDILENKPYFTKQELSFLLDKRGRNLDKKILTLLNNGVLISLKKGLYMTPNYLKMYTGKVEEYIANVLYYPSYLSLEYVLQKEGLIPEAVYSYTSVSLKVSRTFTNRVGTFLYRTVKEPLFTGFTLVPYRENYQIKIASKAKALFDYLYLKPFKRSQSVIGQEIFEDMRLNWEMITREDMEEFFSYVVISSSPKMARIKRVVERRFL